MVIVHPDSILYGPVKPEDGRYLVEEHLYKGRIVDDLLAPPKLLTGQIGWLRSHKGYNPPAPAWSTELAYLYLATQLTPGPTQREADEAIELLHVPLADTIEMIQTGAIIDGKTMAALLLAQRRLNTEGREP